MVRIFSPRLGRKEEVAKDIQLVLDTLSFDTVFFHYIGATYQFSQLFTLTQTEEETPCNLKIMRILRFVTLNLPRSHKKHIVR